MSYARADMPVVEVVWVDANSLRGWHDPDEMLTTTSEGMECRTAGYLFADLDDRIVVVQNQNEPGQLGEAMTIPKVCIRTMQRLAAP